MILRRLTEADAGDARALWQTLFGDTDAFTSWYFSHRFCPQRSFGMFEGNTLLAMTLGREVPVAVAGKPCRALLISGVCTVPAYRKQGMMHRLVAAQLADVKADGFDFAYLHPVRDDLYKKLGFVDATRSGKLCLEAATPAAGLTVSECDAPAVLLSVYQAFCRTHNGMAIRDEKAFALCMADYAQDGGKCLVAQDETGETVGYACYLPCDAEVPELLGVRKEAFDALLHAVLERVKRPVTATIPPECVPESARAVGMQYALLHANFSLPLQNGFCLDSY